MPSYGVSLLSGGLDSTTVTALAKDKTAHFLLEGEKGSKYPVSAPFFGPHANEKQYPNEEFLHDYRQFFQSYMTCFIYWLRENGAADAAVSHKKYSELMRGMGQLRFNGNDFDQLVFDIYGLPISGKNGDTDNLEWRFLKFIAGQ